MEQTVQIKKINHHALRKLLKTCPTNAGKGSQINLGDFRVDKVFDDPSIRFCNGKSVWDILSKHSDFTNTIAFKPSDREMIRPRIKVYHQAPRRIILALDASTSMLIGGKLEMVRQAAKRFIYAISEGKTLCLTDNRTNHIVYFATNYCKNRHGLAGSKC